VISLRHLRHNDDGFTLIEILIAIVCLGVILPAVVMTFQVVLKTTDETNKRIIDSNDIQTAAGYVSGDVQNATGVASQVAPTCTSSQLPPASNATLVLTWIDKAAATDVAHSVNYYVDNDSELVRTECKGATLGTATLFTDLVVIHEVAGGGSAPDVVCQASGCNAAATPVSVALRGKTAKSGQFFSLIGTRRTS
jgi:prepilin-type N-terminal cleavage/methylation domain-containing protein